MFSKFRKLFSRPVPTAVSNDPLIETLQTRITKMHIEPIRYAQVTTYPLLKKATIHAEASSYREALLTLLKQSRDVEKFKQKFKKLCRKRESQIKDTFLDYTAQPNGECNRLFWDLAEILFSPQTLQEMIAILCPSIQYEYRIQTSDELLPKVSQNQKITELAQLYLASQGIEEIDQWNPRARNIEQFKSIVRHKDHFINMQPFSKIDRPLHKKIFALLQRKVPDLLKKMKAHSSAYSKLIDEFDAENNNGIRIGDMINKTRISFARGNTYMTGESDASIQASSDASIFLEFINDLPDTIKPTVLDLCGANKKKTIGLICQKIRAKECAFSLSKDLKEIEDNENNKAVLNTRVLPKWLRKKDSNRKFIKPMCIGFDPTTRIPSLYIEPILRHVVIKKPHQYYDILLELVPSQYEMFLTNITLDMKRPLPLKFTELVGDFSKEQLQALAEVVCKHPHLFGPANDIFRAGLIWNNLKLAITARCTPGYSMAPKEAVSFAATHSSRETFQYVLATIPHPKEFLTLQTLKLALGNRDLSVATLILHNSDFQQRFSFYETPVASLIKRMKTLEHLKLLLSFCPENNLTVVLNQRDDRGRGILMNCISNNFFSSNEIKHFLKTLTKQQARMLAMQVDHNGVNSFHAMAAREQNENLNLSDYIPDNVLSDEDVSHLKSSVTHVGLTFKHYANINLTFRYLQNRFLLESYLENLCRRIAIFFVFILQSLVTPSNEKYWENFPIELKLGVMPYAPELLYRYFIRDPSPLPVGSIHSALELMSKLALGTIMAITMLLHMPLNLLLTIYCDTPDYLQEAFDKLYAAAAAEGLVGEPERFYDTLKQSIVLDHDGVCITSDDKFKGFFYQHKQETVAINKFFKCGLVLEQYEGMAFADVSTSPEASPSSRMSH